MSQLKITNAGIAYKNAVFAGTEPLNITKMVFANVPGTNANTTINADAKIPTSNVVHTQAIQRISSLDGDAVVLSAALGYDVGNFTFNWFGAVAVDKSGKDVLVAVVHTNTQTKTKTNGSQVGDYSVKSIVWRSEQIAGNLNVSLPTLPWQVNDGVFATQQDKSDLQSLISAIAEKLEKRAHAKRVSVDLSTQIQKSAYRKSVIALCQLNHTNDNFNSFSEGTLHFHRSNAIVPEITAEVVVSRKYKSTNARGHILVKGDLAEVKLCTFMYGGNKYAGVHFYHSGPEHSDVFFDGSSNFEVFGLDYLDARGTVLNTEINSSLSFSGDIGIDDGLYFNGDKVLREKYFDAPLIIGSDIDLNDFHKKTENLFVSSSATVLNKPANSAPFLVEVVCGDTGGNGYRCRQVATNYMQKVTYERYLDQSNTWSDWFRLLKNSDLASQSESLDADTESKAATPKGVAQYGEKHGIGNRQSLKSDNFITRSFDLRIDGLSRVAFPDLPATACDILVYGSTDETGTATNFVGRFTKYGSTWSAVAIYGGTDSSNRPSIEIFNNAPHFKNNHTSQYPFSFYCQIACQSLGNAKPFNFFSAVYSPDNLPTKLVDGDAKFEKDGDIYKLTTKHGSLAVGCSSSSWCHFFTTAPAFYFGKSLHVLGEIYAGANYNKKVYHEGNKPTASDVGAMPKTGGVFDGIVYANQGVSWRCTLQSTSNAIGFDVYKHDGSARVGGGGIFSLSGGATDAIAYLGCGTSPWNGTEGIRVNASMFKYKNFDVAHSGNLKDLVLSGIAKPTSGSLSLGENHLTTNNTIKLPATTGLAADSVVKVTKRFAVTPQIAVANPETDKIAAMQDSIIKHSTYLIFDRPQQLIFILNDNKEWELN